MGRVWHFLSFANTRPVRDHMGIYHYKFDDYNFQPVCRPVLLYRIEKCREMSRNVEKCREMSSFLFLSDSRSVRTSLVFYTCLVKRVSEDTKKILSSSVTKILC